MVKGTRIIFLTGFLEHIFGTLGRETKVVGSVSKHLILEMDDSHVSQTDALRKSIATHHLESISKIHDHQLVSLVKEIIVGELPRGCVILERSIQLSGLPTSDRLIDGLGIEFTRVTDHAHMHLLVQDLDGFERMGSHFSEGARSQDTDDHHASKEEEG